MHVIFLLLNKMVSPGHQKREFNTVVFFLVKFAKFSRTAFFYRTPSVAASGITEQIKILKDDVHKLSLFIFTFTVDPQKASNIINSEFRKVCTTLQYII